MKPSIALIRPPMSTPRLHIWAHARFDELIAAGAGMVGAIEQVVSEAGSVVTNEDHHAP